MSTKCICGNEATMTNRGLYCYVCREFVDPITATIGARFDFKAAYEGVCPCGQRFGVGEATFTDGNTVPCVIHVEPYCKPFIDLSHDDFMAYVVAKQE